MEVAIDAVAKITAEFLSLYSQAVGDADLRTIVSEIKGRGAFLLVAVKTRVYETGGEWLNYRAEGWFQHCLDDIDSVVFERMDANVRASPPTDLRQALSRLVDLERAALDGADLLSRAFRLIDAASVFGDSAHQAK